MVRNLDALNASQKSFNISCDSESFTTENIESNHKISLIKNLVLKVNELVLERLLNNNIIISADIGAIAGFSLASFMIICEYNHGNLDFYHDYDLKKIQFVTENLIMFGIVSGAVLGCGYNMLRFCHKKFNTL